MKLRIAVAQTPGSRIAAWRETLERITSLVTDAAGHGADVVLLPECVWPAYVLASPAEYYAAREAGLPGPEFFLERLRDHARRQHLAICAGYIDEQPPMLRNRAVLIDAHGRVRGTCDKCFLWDCDRGLFTPGQRIEPVDAPWGPVGMMICADARLPEIPATLVARGARLILQPTAWVNVGTAEQPWNPQPELLIPERCRELGIPIASASKWGREADTPFVGSSIICDAAGRILAQCRPDRTELIAADVTLHPPRAARLSASLRERLLAPRPASPPAADAGLLRVAIEPDGRVRLTNVPATRAEPAAGRHAMPRSEADTPGTEAGPVVLEGPRSEPVRVGRALVGATGDHDADGFAPIRAMALDGVHVVLVFGDRAAERTLRCRAAENRVFIIRVARGTLHALAPDGNAVPAERDTPAACDATPRFVLDLARAADKHFAPGTDPFADRRPELYTF